MATRCLRPRAGVAALVWMGTLAMGDNDGIPDDQDTSDGSLPPVPGETFDARVVSGRVLVKRPRHRPGGGLPAPQDGVREGGAHLPGTRDARGQQASTEEVTWGRA
jgi:hypothetical protein